jgi:hypothetical protein
MPTLVAAKPESATVLSLGRRRAIRAHRRFLGLPEQWRYGRELQEWTRALLCYALEHGQRNNEEIDLTDVAARLRALRPDLEAAAAPQV